MITIILLLIIYISFISLGLPDALLGVAWPMMQQTWQLPLDAIGLISIISIGATFTSSLMSGFLIKKFGTGKITTISCFMTALSIIGISFVPSYVWLLFIVIPLGFGAGAVDTALNNYVALHFKAHHMNWLHSFWGLGATMGPLIMATSIVKTDSWHLGYRTVGSIQLLLAFILLISLPLWGKHKAIENEDLDENKKKTGSVFKVKGVPYALFTFIFYCGLEASIGLLGATYLIATKGITASVAASWVALYYGGITVGRFLSGFISMVLTQKQMIRYGIYTVTAGIILIFIPFLHSLTMIGFILSGLGLSPIFPSMTHETPVFFGKEHSQTIIGFQMASANLGIALIPPLFSTIFSVETIWLMPMALLILATGMYLTTSRLYNLKALPET